MLGIASRDFGSINVRSLKKQKILCWDNPKIHTCRKQLLYGVTGQRKGRENFVSLRIQTRCPTGLVITSLWRCHRPFRCGNVVWLVIWLLKGNRTFMTIILEDARKASAGVWEKLVVGVNGLLLLDVHLPEFLSFCIWNLNSF